MYVPNIKAVGQLLIKILSFKIVFRDFFKIVFLANFLNLKQYLKKSKPVDCLDLLCN